MRRLAIGVVLALVALAVLSVFFGHSVTVVIDGQPVSRVFGGLVSVGGGLVAIVALFCAAIVLALVFAGVWLLLTGIAVFVIFILLAVMSPFLLPLLVPLGIVWLLVAIIDGGGRRRPT